MVKTYVTIEEMDKKTLNALKKSIKKWERIEDGAGVDHGFDNCPLCTKFLSPDHDEPCNRCPVRFSTGRNYCEGTPYRRWSELCLHRLEIDPTWNKKADRKYLVDAARRERKFLESLLPKDGKK